ncbi:sugar transporter family protein [Talaromyces stipitatus ATCC 10500]|uniref:Sugar transporter family protein n=1 Tax=Talaromyces stipitatus (strain ATCC 10500 / CBS 375.48 / QM 6759 / NRRL 1006) TaxID=441959 RepID=B8MRY9_TALSN|nr:sugar transporter family protein [Talaromyces stipitatus ATCC 10500]EED13425.1 sugar transporter family protein [Talaromyces stipitatus ATCC 10500]
MSTLEPNSERKPWLYSRTQILSYLSTRLTTLVPQRSNFSARTSPIKIFKRVTRAQWLMFLCGVLGRAWDAFDYTTVPLTVTELGKHFNKPASAVSWAITATLMTRPLGALIFGVCCDRYGRKWPMIINLVLLMILELVSGFCNNLPQFIGVRSLYGIAMGGLIGPSAAIALEDLPPDARGLLSGVFEGGTSMGNLFASTMYRALVPTTKHGWRSLYWFGAGPPIIIIIFRWWLPETNHFLMIKTEREARTRQKKANATLDLEAGRTKHASEFKTFLHDSKKSIKENWLLLLYMFLLMTGFNACVHGAADLYPTFLKNQVRLDPAHTAIISILGNLGAGTGGIILGYISGFLGRRLTMICGCILGAALLPAYILTRGMKIGACVFFQHFATVGVWGPIPIHLVTLAPYALRTLMVGLTYQLGNLASSPITTAESFYGEKYPLQPAADGTKRYDYGRAIAIVTAASWAYMLLFLFIGPEASPETEMQDVGMTVYNGGSVSEPPSPTDSIEKGPIVLESEYDDAKIGSVSHSRLG